MFEEGEKMPYESEKGLELLAKYIGKPDKTNCYLSYPQLKSLLENNKGQIEFGSKCIYFLVEKDDYIELYFFADNIVDLSEEREDLQRILPSDKDVIISIVLNGKQVDKYEHIMQNLGFSLYKKYLRKKRKIDTSVEIPSQENVCLAEPADIDFMKEMIFETFDSISDKIPNRFELEKMISNGQILKYVITDRLAGFLIYERQGKKSYVRMLCTGENFRGNGVGKSLLREYIKREYNHVKLFYLWVDSQNEAALSLYSKEGYISDGLEQYIFIRRCE